MDKGVKENSDTLKPTTNAPAASRDQKPLD